MVQRPSPRWLKHGCWRHISGCVLARNESSVRQVALVERYSTGGDRFVELWNDARLLNAFGNTLLVALAVVTISVPIGTAAGMMTFLQFAFGTVAAQAQGSFDHSTVWPVLGFIIAGNGLSAVFAFWAIASRKRLGAS